jgi:hypothetical protein
MYGQSKGKKVIYMGGNEKNQQKTLDIPPVPKFFFISFHKKKEKKKPEFFDIFNLFFFSFSDAIRQVDQ